LAIQGAAMAVPRMARRDAVMMVMDCLLPCGAVLCRPEPLILL
jgi:hypothetical protein